MQRLAESDEEARQLLLAASIVRRNWQRFDCNIAKRQGSKAASLGTRADAENGKGHVWQMDDEDDDGGDEESEAISAFEEQWWKAVKAGATASFS